MKKIFSLFVILVMVSACGGGEDEDSLVSDPDEIVNSVLNQTLLYVGGDSAFVPESPQPLRFIAEIACADSCMSQVTSFHYDGKHRLDGIQERFVVNGKENRRQTSFVYSPDRISYVTAYFVDSVCVVRKDKGYVLMDKKGRAARGSRMQWKQTSWADNSWSAFQFPQNVTRSDGRKPGWIRCTTDYEYRYDAEDALLQVNRSLREDNSDSSERSDVMWDAGNLVLISDAHVDYSYIYSRVPNKSNVDLNRYLVYTFIENTDCTDALMGLLGVYGTRSAQLWSEYADEHCTFNLSYETDDEGYVTRIHAGRTLHDSLYGVNAEQASETWARVDQGCASRPAASAGQSAAPTALTQCLTFTVSYL